MDLPNSVRERIIAYLLLGIIVLTTFYVAFNSLNRYAPHSLVTDVDAQEREFFSY
jgi:hypothetical protein